MPVELRKRKAPAEAAPPPPAKKAGAGRGSKTATTPKASKATSEKPAAKAASKSAAKTAEKAGATADKAVAGKPAAKAASSSAAPTAGDTIDLEGFGGEFETNDGEKTTLKKLVDASKGGVVLLAYPKASTPGCTNQVCFARDAFTQLTSTGLSIYGLSRDSPKSNTNFKTKQNLPYSLLCDQSGSLITAIGLKKAPSGTMRGVFVVDKQGKVLIAQSGGPAATVEAVKALVDEGKPEGGAKAEKE